MLVAVEAWFFAGLGTGMYRLCWAACRFWWDRIVFNSWFLTMVSAPFSLRTAVPFLLRTAVPLLLRAAVPFLMSSYRFWLGGTAFAEIVPFFVEIVPFSLGSYRLGGGKRNGSDEGWC